MIHITAFLYVLYISAIIWQRLCTYTRSLLGGLYAVMTINTLYFPMQTSYYLDEYIIQQSQSATYLGIKIDQRLKWSEHIQ